MLCLAFVLFVIPSAASIDVVVVGGEDVCAGDTASVQCTLTGDILTWNTPQGAINILRGRQRSGETGAYTWRVEELDENTLQSTLIFMVTALITMGCDDGSNSSVVTVRIEDPPSAPDRPLTGLDRIKWKNTTFSTVTVVWNIPDSNNAHISSYVVTVNPSIAMPANGVIAAADPQFQTREISLELQHGQRYDITVRADSCDNAQQGSTSTPLTINIQVPPPVSRCTALPVYDYFSSGLNTIEIQWEPISEFQEDITNGIISDVQSYLISMVPIGTTVPLINITISANDGGICTNTCKYRFQNTTEMLALYYSVFVIAKNILNDGYSDSKTCSNETISARNDLLDVEVRQKGTNGVEVLCRLLSRFKGTANCEVMYTVYTVLPYHTVKSERIGGAEDVIIVFLSESFEPNTLVTLETYTVGGKQDAKVLGVFTADNVSTTETHCPYQPVQNISDVLSTQENLTFSSNILPEMDNSSVKMNVTQCIYPLNETDTKTSIRTSWIIATVTFVVALPVGIVGGIAIMALCYLRKKNEAKGLPNSFYDYISPQDKDITIQSNKCYMTKTAPKLPQPRESKTN